MICHGGMPVRPFIPELFVDLDNDDDFNNSLVYFHIKLIKLLLYTEILLKHISIRNVMRQNKIPISNSIIGNMSCG